MVARKMKATVLHLLLILASLIQPILTQQLTNVNQGKFFPQGQFSSFPSNKGYIPPQTDLGYYYTHPVNSQYWTGSTGSHLQIPHLQQPFYQQYPLNYPNQQAMWTTPQASYNQWNTMQYQQFDPNYWTGAHLNPQYYRPMYPQPLPVYPHPAYHPQPVYHPAFHQRPMYPGQYPYRPVPFGADPYSQRGFFGGTGKGLTKGLLGALVVGVVAGAVARGK